MISPFTDQGQPVPLLSNAERGSSEWWIQRLSMSLYSRAGRLRRLEAYYRGEQSLSRLASLAWRESGLNRVFPGYLHANHSKLIVNAAANRLVILGFRLPGEFRADVRAQEIWQLNGMDAESDRANMESLIKGECPILVEPDGDGNPLITAQDPLQMVVWHAAGDRRLRLAALKAWWDDEAQLRRYILYLPDRIERWQDATTNRSDPWIDRAPAIKAGTLVMTEDPDRPPVVGNRLGKVPVVVVPNEPRLTSAPEAEHEPVLSRIDHYNKTLMDMAITTSELAFPQRYATGAEAGEEPDAEGVTRPPVRTGQTRWITTENPDAHFGQFDAATVDNYVKALDQIRADIATDTFTPYHFLLNMPSSVPPSGESITAAEAPLVDKIRGHQRDKGAPWREVLALAFEISGDTKRAAAMRTAGTVIWADPERRTESQHIDALGKAVTMLGLPIEAAWELLPASPQDMQRWRDMRTAVPAVPVVAPPPAAEPPTGTQGSGGA